jgi:hypothetical protein
MRRIMLGTLAVGALLVATSAHASASLQAPKVSDRALLAVGIDSGPYNSGPPVTYNKNGPIATFIDGHLSTGSNHVVSRDAKDGGGFVGTVTYANGDSWTDTALSTDQTMDVSDIVCPTDLPFPFKTTARITGGTGRFTSATGSLLIKTCNKVTGPTNGLVLTTAFTITGDIRY